MVEVTPLASEKLERVLEEEGHKGALLRVMVSPGPHGGFQYMLGIEDKAGENDFVIDAEGVQVLVDAESAPLVEGAQIDYVEGLMRSGFVISKSEPPERRRWWMRLRWRRGRRRMRRRRWWMRLRWRRGRRRRRWWRLWMRGALTFTVGLLLRAGRGNSSRSQFLPPLSPPTRLRPAVHGPDQGAA